MQNYRNGKWANQIISMQHPDGSWGCFHTLRGDSDTPMTTEMALLRLELLGYTAEDKCIKIAIAHMETLLHTGELPEGKEKTSDFETIRRRSVESLRAEDLSILSTSISYPYFPVCLISRQKALCSITC